jgi:hypothetical protein
MSRALACLNSELIHRGTSHILLNKRVLGAGSIAPARLASVRGGMMMVAMMHAVLLWNLMPSVVGQESALNFSGINGWYNSCELDANLCGGADLKPVDPPLYFDFDLCFSNPYLGFRSVSFFTKNALGAAQLYNVIFTTDAGMATYSPTSCDSRGACPCDTPPSLANLRSQLVEDPSACVNEGGNFSCAVSGFVGSNETCWVPKTVISVDNNNIYCSMVANQDLFPLGSSPIASAEPSPAPTSTPTDLQTPVPGGTEAPTAVMTPGKSPSQIPSSTPTQVPSTVPTAVIMPSESPSQNQTGTPNQVPTSGETEVPTGATGPVAQSPNFDVDIAPELGDTAITGWWTGCTFKEISNNDNNQCTAATNIRMEEPIYLDLQTGYSNPNLKHRSVTFFLKDDNGQAYAYHLLFNSSESWETYRPICDDYGECVIESSDILVSYRDGLLPAKACDDGFGFTCKREMFDGLSSFCYVPAQEIFQNELVCSMAASLQQIPRSGGQDGATQDQKGATNSAASSTQSGLPGWAIAVIVIATIIVAFVIFAIVVCCIQYRRTGEFFSPDDLEEEEWVRAGSHNSKFTRRALNTDDTADGVWKRSNIHDLKFQMTL